MKNCKMIFSNQIILHDIELNYFKFFDQIWSYESLQKHINLFQ
jgi:hypothetical protein